MRIIHAELYAAEILSQVDCVIPQSLFLMEPRRFELRFPALQAGTLPVVLEFRSTTT